MVARQSQLFIPTLREPPSDAEAVSHKLLVRGGYIRQLSAGVWTFLPLGWRVHQKVVQIIREEMDAIGGQEMLMPVLTPRELWIESGRDFIPEIFNLVESDLTNALRLGFHGASWIVVSYFGDYRVGRMPS